MNTLIIYFTMDGHTKNVVNQIEKYIDADEFRVEREKPYNPNYQVYAYGEAKEEAEKELRPAVKGPLPDISNYDRYIVAVPVWWYTAPMPVLTFLESYKDWGGKPMYVFADAFYSYHSQYKTTFEAVKKSAHGADVQRGLYNDEIRDIASWLVKNGFERKTQKTFS